MKLTTSYTKKVPGRDESGEGPDRPLIRILDDVVIGDGEYASFKEQGLL